MRCTRRKTIFLNIEIKKMVCVVCSRTTQQNESADCFETALENIKKHYNYYRNAIRKRELENLQLKERNEELLKALQLLQISQPPAKRLKASVEGSWQAPNPCNRNTCKEDGSTDVSLTDCYDDDNDVAGGGSNLNMAINSEQLFETSVLSPAPNVSHSEIITSPRTRESPRRNKQRDELRSPKDCNQPLQKSKSECYIKQRSSPSDKSWASKFIKPAVKVKVAENRDGADTKKPEKRLNLSLTKVNPSKMKQSLLHFNNSKEPSLVESDVCNEIIDASPVAIKNSKWAQRSGLSHSNALNNSSLVGAETRQSHDDTTSIPIENIVFDFSPSKKPEHTDVTGRSSCKQLNFNKVANKLTRECAEIPFDQSTMESQGSSVVFLTPTTQDIIFVDDTCDEINNADTMDLMADIMKPDNTETLKKLKQYESKNMEKHLRQIENKSNFANEKKVPVIVPLTSVKKEKCTELLMEKCKEQEENVLKGLTASNREDGSINPLLHEPEDQEGEEDDAMPRPFLIKQESENKTTFKKRSLKERFNINCDECEKYFNFFGDNLSDDELAKHINQCTQHKQPENLRQNTPENFWNPFILSFPQNDPRNQVLFDNRSKNKEQMGKH